MFWPSKDMEKKRLNFSAWIFVFGVLFFVPTVSHAADLGVFSSVPSETVGDTFRLVVTVSSPETPMNAVSGVLSFPTDLLEVVDISTESSVMNFWVHEPSF